MFLINEKESESVFSLRVFVVVVGGGAAAYF